jgi:MerR family transcriptional regulator, light-induced transcriptional regulator
MKMYNINSVSKITGLSAFVIRAWEKRYNVVTPGRTEGNRRFYSEDDLEKLKLLKEAVDKGNNIGSVAGLSITSLKEMLARFGSSSPKNLTPSNGTPASADTFLQQCIESVQELDYRNLEKNLIRASIELSHPLLIEKVILPLLQSIGEGWQSGSLRVVQEHLASAVIRTFLYNLRDSYKSTEHGSKILLTTPMGQQHEFGALIASLVASSEGWDTVYLGPDLPVSEIVAASQLLNPKIVALSIVFSAEDEYLKRELEKLKYLPEGIKLIAGGAGIRFYQKTIEENKGIIIEDMNSFRNFLRTSGTENQ